MDVTTMALLGVFIIGMFFMYIQIKSIKDKKDDSESQVLMEWLKSMRSEMTSSIDKNSEVLERQLSEQRKTLDEQMRGHRDTMQKQTEFIGQRLDNAQNVIQTVQKQLVGFEKFGKDVEDLSNVLKSPKLRGGMGEQFLYEILANILPKELYTTQYKFRDGAVCDAAIIVEKGIIPIDAKFSLENYKASALAVNAEDKEKFRKVYLSDVKKRVDEISSKYILPNEGTMDQVVMYIPSETVYYDTVVTTDLEEYARNKNVLLTGPHTLSSFLKVLLVAYKHKQLEKHAGEILKALGSIKIEAEKFNDELGVLERHISNSYKSMDGVKMRFQRLFTRIETTQLLPAPEPEKTQKQVKDPS